MFDLSKIPILGTILNLYKKITGQNSDGSNTITEDVADALMRLLMRQAAKIFLDHVPRNIYDNLIANNQEGINWLNTLPTAIRAFTHFSDFTDDAISEFFEQVKNALERRRNHAETIKSENAIRCVYMELLSEATDAAERKKMVDAFTPLFADEKLTEVRRCRLIEFLNDLDKVQLKAFLLLTDEERNAVLSFSGVVESKQLKDSIEELKKLFASSTEVIDDFFKPGSVLSDLSEDFLAFAKKYKKNSRRCKKASKKAAKKRNKAKKKKEVKEREWLVRAPGQGSPYIQYSTNNQSLI